MQMSHRSPAQRGFALLITMLLVAVLLLAFASILGWAFTNAKITQQNNQYNMSENAAESAVERVIGQMDRDFISAALSNGVSAYQTLPTTIDQSAWPVQYTFSDTNGIQGQISIVMAPAAGSTVSNSQYAGLSDYAQQVDVYATATPVGQSYSVPASVHESFQLVNIPLFQYAIFYNVNLEIMSAATLDIYGPVFCNQSIWEGSTLAVFHSTVSAVGTNYLQVADPFSKDYTGSGASQFLKAGQPVNRVNPLVMPVGTNNDPGSVLALLRLPPPDYAMGTPAAYTSNGLVYPANSADLVITNFAYGTNDGNATPTGTNYIVYFQDSSLTPLAYDFFIMTNRSRQLRYITNTSAGFETNIVFAGMSWLTNSVFWDWREGWNGGSGPAKRVEAVEIDMLKLNTWLANQIAPISGYTVDQTKYQHTHHHIGGIYVFNSVPLTSSQMPAVRVVNGAQLPNPDNSTLPYGVSVATAVPIYVKGNFNSQTFAGSCAGQYGTAGSTRYTVPAALMGDSVTILSGSWSDTKTSASTGANGGPNAQDTTVNAAMLEGIVQSNPNVSGNLGMNGDYSGGVENFLRLLENWGGDKLTYNGSIVVLFYSQYATNCWRQTGHYYSAPTRQWAFDLNFNDPTKLPPLTPQIRAMIRGNWYAHQ